MNKKSQLTDSRIINIIVKIVSNYYQITPITIFSQTRKYYPKTARQIIQYLIKKNTKLSLEEIGKVSLLYGRDKAHDHASILHSCKCVENNKETDRDYLYDLTAIQNTYKQRTETLSLVDVQTLKNQDLIYKLEAKILEKNQHVLDLQKSIEIIKESVKTNTENKYLKRLLMLDDETINSFCETRLKPYLLMLDSTIARNKQLSVCKVV